MHVLVSLSVIATLYAVSEGLMFRNDYDRSVLSLEQVHETESESEKPDKCQDLETGTFYKVGAEWYSTDPEACEMLSCEPGYYPRIKVTGCNQYFKRVHHSATVCPLNSRQTFPGCCPQCQ